MRICYVLPHPELNGGNKVIAQHAELLLAGGDEVEILAIGPRPAWFPPGVPYRDLDGATARPGSRDLVIATYWTTIEVALAMEAGPTAHFCQGYEGDLVHLEPQLAAIRAAYARPLPLLAVSSHLAERIGAAFDRPSRVVPPPVDCRFRPRPRWGPRRRPTVVVPGIFEAAVKDVPTALRAVLRLRADGLDCRVVRTSILRLTAEESRLLEPDRYLCGVMPEQVASTLRQADLLLLPSRPGEGFGLPLLEALASGLPAVASRLPSTEAMAAGAVPLVEPGDVDGFATAAGELLRSRSRWREARRRGLAAAEAFAPERVAPVLRDAVRWAAGC